MYLAVGKLFAVLSFVVLIILPFTHKGRMLLSALFGEKILGQFFEACETKERFKKEFEDCTLIMIASVVTIMSIMYLVFAIIFSVLVSIAYPLVILMLLVTRVLNKKLNND